MVGTTIGLIIAAGIAGGATVAGSKMAANASKDATKTASDASVRAAEIDATGQKEALDFTKQAYATEQRQLAPYVGTGGAAVSKLSQMMGLGTPAPYVDPNAYVPGKPLPADPSHIPPGQNFPASWVPGSPSYTGPPQALAVMGATKQAHPGAPTTGQAVPRGSLSTMAAGSGPTVTMVAPDGSEQQVASQDVSHYLQLGAQIKPGSQPMAGGAV